MECGFESRPRHQLRGSAGVGEPDQTVNLTRELSRFESYFPHQIHERKNEMATIDGFKMQPIFPKHYIEYVLDFSDEDQQAIDKWTNDQQIISFNNQNKHLEKYEGQFLNDSFQTLYTFNILKTAPELSGIYKTVLDCANHYIKSALKFYIPTECRIDVSDSWMIRVKGDSNKPGLFKGYSNKMSSITGILFLQDSKNATALSKFEKVDDFYPFCWDKGMSEFTTQEIYIECKKGRLVLFPSTMLHSLYRCEDNNDIRFSLGINLWPYGTVSDDNTYKLSY